VQPALKALPRPLGQFATALSLQGSTRTVRWARAPSPSLPAHCVAFFAVVLFNGRALAQSAAENNGLQEIIVTAQHRTEDLQNVPISMDAITGETMDKLGEVNFFDYASTIPNLSVGVGSGSGGGINSGEGVSTSRAVTIRGVAGNNTTGLYLDDTPVPLNLDPRVIDMDRIEVLRGPQGTLFGEGSMGGTIRIITRVPSLDQFSGKVEGDATYVDDGGGGYSVNGTMNLPMLDKSVALRVSAFSAFDPGVFSRCWGVDTVPSVDLPPGAPSGCKQHVGSSQNTGVLTSLAIAPAVVPGLTVTPMFIYQRSNYNGYPLADYTASDLVQNRPLNVPEGVQSTWDFASLTLKYDTPYGRLVGYATNFWQGGIDVEDGTDFVAGVLPGGFNYFVPAPIWNAVYTKTWSGEMRFESKLPGPVQFVFGLFDTLNEVHYYENQYSPGANAASGGALGTDNLYYTYQPYTDRQRAAFLNVSYDVTSALQVSAGIRVAYLARSYTAFADGWYNGGPSYNSGDHTETDKAPRYTAQYQIASGQMVYASAARGFRIGGENPPTLPVCGPGLASGSQYDTDSLWSFEIGSKNSWFDGRVKSRIALYRIDWSDIQQEEVLNTLCSEGVVTNSGYAVSKGAEFELDAAVSEHLTVNLATGYEDAKITEAAPGSLTVVGQRLNQVPEWTGSATAQYSIPIDASRSAFLRGVWTYTGPRTTYNDNPAGIRLAGYDLLNLRAGVAQGPWEIALFGDNVFNRYAAIGQLIPESGQIPGRPRFLTTRPLTVGLHVRRGF
jgi:iron complex outermembrane recepter protein